MNHLQQRRTKTTVSNEPTKTRINNQESFVLSGGNNGKELSTMSWPSADLGPVLPAIGCAEKSNRTETIISVKQEGNCVP